MQTAAECYAALAAELAPARRQLELSQFIDDFRRASDEERIACTRDPVTESDALAALLAATVEALSVECDVPPPVWVRDKVSPEPYFAFGARTFELRVRLMLESPPAFKIRRVFVPENFLSRA